LGIALGINDYKVKQNRKETIMIVFDIAEWVANILVLGLGMFFWTIAIAVAFLVITELVSKVSQ
jgi:hypothetical protein|tara:strand:- start:11004 stop:11195 length:192 start_codon:yes stop_codon:yes gene_type:complete